MNDYRSAFDDAADAYRELAPKRPRIYEVPGEKPRASTRRRHGGKYSRSRKPRRRSTSELRWKTLGGASLRTTVAMSTGELAWCKQAAQRFVRDSMGRLQVGAVLGLVLAFGFDTLRKLTPEQMERIAMPPVPAHESPVTHKTILGRLGITPPENFSEGDGTDEKHT